MGYGRRDYGQIQTFWPDDDENTIYVEGGVSLADLLELAQAKWPDITVDQINVAAQNFHTDCLGYDSYDPTDYTDFIVITRRA